MTAPQLWARLFLVAMLLLVAACGPNAAPSQVTTMPTPSVGPTTPRPPSPSASALSADEPSGSGGAFTVCATAVQTSACPLQPSSYTAAVHDQFSFSISEAGWQEERAVAGEFDTRVVLSRVDEPRQRLSFLSGPTGPTSPVVVDPAALIAPGFKVGQPTAVLIGGTQAVSIDIEPAGARDASSVTIETQKIRLEPDHKYRVTVSRIPMDQEAATLIMVTESPVDTFATFVTTAERVLQTVRF